MKKYFILTFSIFLISFTRPVGAFEWDVFGAPSGDLRSCLLNSLDEDSLKKLLGGRPEKKQMRKKAKRAYKVCAKSIHKKIIQPLEHFMPFIDVHAHLIGADYSGALAKALFLMKKINIKQMIIMPPPQTFDQEFGDKIEDYIDLVNESDGKFKILGGGGTLMPMIMKAHSNGFIGAALVKEFEKRAKEIISMGAIGFGEMTAEHVSRRHGHPYVSVPVDHPLFLRLADIAANFDVPIDLHMEAVPEEMVIPEKLKFSPNPDKLNANLRGLKTLLSHNLKTKIIWSHCGWGNLGTRKPDLMRELLLSHSNLYMSIKLNKSGVKSVSPVANGGRKIRSEWLSLFKDFPNRFMIGTDVKPSARGIHKQSNKVPIRTPNFLNNLPKGLAKKIAEENAKRIFRL